MPASPNSKSNARSQQGKSRTARLSWSLGLVVLVLGVWAAWFFWPPSLADDSEAGGPKPNSSHKVFVNLLTLEDQRQIQIPIWYSGEVRARRKTRVSFPRGGKVIEVLFDEGDFVNEETPIARLDSRQPTARLNQVKAEATMATAMQDEMVQGPRNEEIRSAAANVDDLQRQLENAVIDFERSGRLLEKRGISQQEFDQSDLLVKTLQARIASAKARFEQLDSGTRVEQIDAAKARLQSANAAVQLAQADVDDCTLKAPFSGTIAERMLDEGAVVDAGTPIFMLIESDHLELHVGVPVELASTITIGQTLTVQVGEVKTNATLKNKLKALDLATRTQKLVLALDSNANELGIVDGQLGQIEFEQTTDTEGFTIPASAIINDQRGLWSCYTVSEVDGKMIAKRQAVEVLHFQGEWVAVRGTLSPGQAVIVNGLQRLSSGQAVEVADGSSNDEVN